MAFRDNSVKRNEVPWRSGIKQQWGGKMGFSVIFGRCIFLTFKDIIM